MDKAGEPAEETYADRVNRQLASIAGWVLEERIPYDCPWDDFRFMYFRGKDGETASRELGAWADSLGIDVEFEQRREHSFEARHDFLLLVCGIY